MSKARLDWIIGVLLIALSGFLCVRSFWTIGREVRDSVAVTSYVTRLSPGGRRTFGYGGEGDDQKVDVVFQGREMSNVSFAISRDQAGKYWITGEDDEILINKILIPPKQQTELNTRDTFEARGPLGRAAFTALSDTETDVLRLVLKAPVFREFRTYPTRLVFGSSHNPIPSPIDEIFLRTQDLGPGGNYRVWAESEGLRLEGEKDLAKIANPTSPRSAGDNTSSSVESIGGAQTDLLKPNQIRTVGTLEFVFRQYAPLPNAVLGLTSTKLFGIRVLAAALLFGLAYLVGPQTRWPLAPLTIFGCALLFVTIGLVLSARDFFFYPHQEKFQEYVAVLYWSAIFLFALRVPFDPDTEESRRSFYLRLLIPVCSFLIAYFLVNNSFDWSTRPFGSAIYAVLRILLVFILCLAVSLVGQLISRGWLKNHVEAVWDERRFRRWLVAPLAFFAVGLLVTRFILGGHEAIVLAGLRIHLPTLLLPLIVLWFSILVLASESNSDSKEAWLILSVSAAFCVLLIYRLVSNDNGGNAILAFGVLTVLWLGSRKKVIPITATCIGLVALGVVAWFSQSARFELAWGGDDGRLLFYDAAKNLRIARDMARAGGVFGQSLSLPIPTEVRSNIQSDLVAAYAIGFFGWAVFFVLLAAYTLFYNALFGGLYQALLPTKLGLDAARTIRPRAILLLVAGALLITFAAQALWVLMATLLSFIPLTGLDLQPISFSAISLVSFFVILMGSVAFAHTLNETLAA